MNIVFRVDSNKDIGAGHSMRCIALAEEFLRNKCNVIFISKNNLDFIRTKIEEKGIILESLKAECIHNEISELNRIFKKYRTDLIILDGYNFGYNYQKQLKKCNIKIVYITDFAGKYFCDIVICPTPGLSKKNFASEIETKYFLGAKYIFFRDEVLNFKKRKRTNKKFKILVSFGASFFDINIIKKFILVFEEIYKNAEIRFLIGINKKNNVLTELAENKKNNYYFISSNEFNLQMLSDNNIAFSTASTTLWELTYLNIPFICFYTADNQKQNAEWLSKNNFCYNLGNINKISKSTMADCMSILNKKDVIINKIQKIFDKNSKKYIVHYIIFFINNITIRLMNESDCKFLWSVRNSKNIRKLSFNKSFIPYTHHKKWFINTIKNKNIIIFIILKKNCRIGYVRYEIDTFKVAIVNIAVSSKMQGKHIGLGSLILTSRYLFDNNLAEKINAFIKIDNIPSIKCFQNAGFGNMRKVNYNDDKCIKLTSQ